VRRFVLPAVAAGVLLVCAPFAPAMAQGGCKQSNVGKMFGALARNFGNKLAGTQFGNALSNTIACALSPAEKRKAEETQNSALNSGKTGAASRKTWTSDERKGVGGGTEVVSRSVHDGEQCAVQRTFVTDVDGQQKSVERQICQQADGQWVAA
jgi:surface antigen